MKAFLPLLIIAWLSPSLVAQQDIQLPGVVVEQNSKFLNGKVNYLSNAQLKSSGANPQLSDVNGKFTLVFADRPEGDMANISVVKRGYETVNGKELVQAAVIGRRSPLKVVMCEKGTLAKNQIAYYEVAQRSILATYQKRVNILNRKGQEKDQLIQQLEAEFNQEIRTVSRANELLLERLKKAQQQAQELANKWVTINLDDESETYQEAFRAYLDGDIEKALEIINSVDLEKRLALNAAAIEKEEELIEEIEKRMWKRKQEIEQDVSQVVLKARLQNIQQQYGKAEESYLLAYKYAYEDLNLVFEIAAFYHTNKEFRKCQPFYQKALYIYQKQEEEGRVPDPSKVAKIFSNYGSFLTDQKDYDGARQVLDSALLVMTEVDDLENDVYQDLLANLKLNLGEIYAVLEPEQALPYFEEALSIRRELAKDSSESNLVNLSYALNNYALLVDKEPAIAERYCREGIRILEILSEDSQSRYLHDLATFYGNLGIFRKKQNDLPTAEVYYKKSKSILEELVSQHRKIYLGDLANVTLNYGKALLENNKHVLALPELQQSFRYYQELVEDYPEIYRENLAMLCNEIGILLREQGDIAGAKEKYEIAYPIYEELVKAKPDLYLSDLGIMLNNLGQIHDDNNEFAQAEKYYLRGIEIWRQLVLQEREEYISRLAIALNNLGLVYKDLAKLTEAKTLYQEAIEINRKLIEKYPLLYEGNLISALSNMSNLLVMERQFDEAIKLNQELVKISRKMLALNRDQYISDMISTLINYSLVLWNKELLEEAQKVLEEAAELCRELSQKSPQLASFYFCNLSVNLGSIYWNLYAQSMEVTYKEKGSQLIKEAQQKLLLLNPEVPQVRLISERINMLADRYAN